MAEQLTKLTNLFEGQSIILQEIKSKLTVTEKHDSSLHAGTEEAKTPDPDLNAFQLTDGTAEKEQAMNNQEAADAKGKMMAADRNLAEELAVSELRKEEQAKANKRVSFHTPMTPRELSDFFSGKKKSLNDKNKNN